MKYEVADKFKSKAELDIEVISKRPGSQGIRITNTGENYYDIAINGFKTLMSESVLSLLVDQKADTVDAIAFKFGLGKDIVSEKLVEDKENFIKNMVYKGRHVDKTEIKSPSKADEKVVKSCKRGRLKKGE